MATNKVVNFKLYETLTLFQRDLGNGTIKESSIVFIKDKKLIWTRGIYYAEISNIGSDKVTSMTGYTKAETAGEISSTDSLNTAIGKLEKVVEDNELVTSSALVDLDSRVNNINMTLGGIEELINSKVSSVYRVKGSVANYASLPTTNVEVGDVYTLLDNGSEYVATEVSVDSVTWEYLGEKITISNATTTNDGLMTSQQVQDLENVKSQLVGVDASLTNLEELVR